MKLGYLSGTFDQLFIHQLPKTMIVQTIFFLVYLKIKMPQVIDVTYAFSFFFTALMASTSNLSDFSNLLHFKPMVFLVFVFLWAVRLGGYIIYTRLFPFQIDPRYADLAKNTKHKSLFMMAQFYGQGFATLIIALPLYMIFRQKPTEFTTFNFIGLAVSIVALILHTLSDYQLYTFKKSVNWDRSKTFTGGLWKKSRHPNLFSDIMVWTGMAIAALDTNHLMGTMWAFVGPMTLWSLANFFTAPATDEENLRTKPHYDKIIKTTNKFIPF